MIMIAIIVIIIIPVLQQPDLGLTEWVFVEDTLQKNAMGLKKIADILGTNNSSKKIKCSWLPFVSWKKQFP